jgi:hypothetical protein
VIPGFGKVLFGGSRFIFRALSPFLVLFVVIMTLTVDTSSAERIILLIGLDAAAVLLIFALYDNRRFWWAARGVTAIVFMAYLAGLVDEILRFKAWKTTLQSMESPLSAIDGFIVIGIPSLFYTVLGRFRRNDDTRGDSGEE